MTPAPRTARGAHLAAAGRYVIHVTAQAVMHGERSPYLQR